MSPGKQFEKEFKESVPKHAFFYRFKDSPSGWNGNDNKNVRFTQSNICDCMLVTEKHCCLLELKSCAGASIPFGNFRENQIKEMTSACKFTFLCVGFVVNFRKYKRTYFITIQQFNEFVEATEKKSIPVAYFEEYAIVLPTIRLRKSIKYDLTRLL